MSLKVRSGRLTLPKALAVLVGVLFAGVLVPPAALAASAPVYQQTWGTNGHVSAILADPTAGRVYVAGTFTAVTDATGTTTLPIANVAAFNPATGTFDASWAPNPNGPVTALALSGGQLYLGGTFTKVGGMTRTHLAAVDPVGSGALASWAPAVTGGEVDGLAVNGGWVYLGGNFTSVAGVARSFLGRVSVSTGALDTGWTPQPSARVRALVVPADGSRVYIGGDFTTVNGSGIGRSIASISTASPGTLTAGFDAGATNLGTEAPALALYLDGSNLLAGVAGGGGACASLSSSTGATHWSKHGNGNVQAVTAVGGTVYCGGHFSGLLSFDGQTRDKFAAVDEASGVVLGYSFRINSALGIWALAHDAAHVYLGGDFTKINGIAQPHFGVLTTAAAPAVTTGGSSSVTSAGATVNGTVNPQGSDTTYYFQYGTDTSYGTTTTPGSAGAGTTAQSVSAALTGLAGSTTYHYRLVATNANGTAYGSDATFTTKAAPGVTTGTATLVTSTSATLKGSVNPHGTATSYYFEYGTDTIYGTTTPPGSAGAGSTAVSVSADLTGLTGSTTYHYRLVATNASGSITYGSDATFTTLAGAAAPVVTTGTSSGLTSAGATVKGTVNPQGLDTTYYFQYGTDTSYGTTTTPGSVVAGTTTQNVSADLTGLAASTTYHYRLVATNANGTTFGSDATFTTKAAPGVTTGSATGITSTGATVKGTVNPHGSTTSYYFEFGTDTTYGTTTPPGSAGAGSTAVTVSADLTGLTASTTYHYRLVATNASGSTTYGLDRTFTTPAS